MLDNLKNQFRFFQIQTPFKSAKKLEENAYQISYPIKFKKLWLVFTTKVSTIFPLTIQFNS